MTRHCKAKYEINYEQRVYTVCKSDFLILGSIGNSF